MKGNLIVSSPQNGNADTIAKHEVVDGKRESDTEMVVRIVKMKTGVEIDPSEVSACHKIGKKENHAYVIRLNDRKFGSEWHNLSEGMMTGKSTSHSLLPPCSKSELTLSKWWRNTLMP